MVPYVLGARSFGFRDELADGLIVIGGLPTYSTTNLPSLSDSTTSFGGVNCSFRAPWYGPDRIPVEPSTDELWFHLRYYSSTGADGTLRLGVGRDGTSYVSVTSGADDKIAIRVAGTTRATAAVATFSLATWHRLHVHIEGNQVGDTISVYIDGDLSTPVVSYTLISADVTALAAVGTPDEFFLALKGGGADRVDDLIAWDPAHADFPGIDAFVAVSLKEMMFTGNGPEQQWSGAYTAIDERPPVDTDKIAASAVGQTSSFTKDAVAADNVYAVQIYGRATRTGTAAGAQIGVSMTDGVDSVDVDVPAPGDGYFTVIFDAAPDGTDWSPVSFDAARVAFTSET